MTAVDGSAWVIGEMSTRPPPNRRRRLPVRPLNARVLLAARVGTDPGAETGAEAGAGRSAVACRSAVGSSAGDGAGIGDGIGTGGGVSTRAGAMPQVSQYPSMMDPGQLRSHLTTPPPATPPGRR